MTAVKAGEVEGLLRRGPDPRIAVILVYGPDTGLVAERARLLAEKAVDDPTDPFALVKLDGDVLASDPGRLIDEAGTVGLFGGKRAVWVRSGSRNYAPAVEAALKQEGADTRIVVEAGDLAKSAPLRVVCERSPRALASDSLALPSRNMGIMGEPARRASPSDREKENRMHWLWVFVIGLVVGVVAKLLTPGKDPGGFIITAIIGIAGSLLATWVGQQLFGWYQAGQSAGFIASVVGAVVLLLLYHLVKRKST